MPAVGLVFTAAFAADALRADPRRALLQKGRYPFRSIFTLSFCFIYYLK